MPGADVKGVQEIRLPEHFGPDELRRFRLAVASAPTDGTTVVGGASDTTFCRGLGLDAFGGVGAADREAGLQDFEAAILLLVRSPAPTIAAVRGEALGGGLGVAAACDVVVAERDARFALPEPLFGLIPGLILPVLRTRANGPVLRQLALTGESVDALEAQRVGLVDEVVPAGTLDAAVARWVRRMARAHRGAAGRMKGWLADMDRLAEQVAEGRRHMAELLASDEVLRRVGRFEAGLTPWGEEDGP